ncbi:MAG: ATPase [Methylomonas sp.]|nr:ATPase [Methylomonas sp.]PPD21815.1 MAG: ATPase [Methylomonas sp.]PPD27500.1 MAG: ATPase [Methylomonas sp.]PPD39483.1 MAG: ATPase [Methylomonas sp.]PPD42283.1 MAG: ATPase [Methylomonas sp.]
MKMTPQQFLDWESKSITLLAMSGAGKTTLSNKLPKDKWFHYSGDYRIGTKYLEEPILDNIKQQAMGVPFLRDLFKSDSIYICSNITVDNLAPVASFLGKIGDPAQGGLTLAEFKRRQWLHRQAEIAAMNDVPEFIHKAEDIYGYKHFINDAGGSVCELDCPEVIETLARHTLIVYIKIPPNLEQTLIDRARKEPKPLYYRPEFVDEKLANFMRERGYSSTDQIAPDDFVAWVFPELFRARVPRYEAIAAQHGYIIDGDAAARVQNEAQFIQLIADAIARQTS